MADRTEQDETGIDKDECACHVHWQLHYEVTDNGMLRFLKADVGAAWNAFVPQKVLQLYNFLEDFWEITTFRSETILENNKNLQ